MKLNKLAKRSLENISSHKNHPVCFSGFLTFSKLKSIEVKWQFLMQTVNYGEVQIISSRLAMRKRRQVNEF